MLRVMLTMFWLVTEQATTQPTCTTYKALESFLLNNDENVVNISRSFFPPYLTNVNTSMGYRAYGKIPVFATIIYHYEVQPNIDTGNQYASEEVWLWGESEFHLLEPKNVFQFTSLFFGRTGYHSTLIHLTLPDICKNASNIHMELLTHRLKAYAATHGNTATVNAGMYSGVAANNETLMLQLQQFYNRDQDIPGMTISIHVIFPTVTMLLVVCFGYLYLRYHSDFFTNNTSHRSDIATSNRENEIIALRVQGTDNSSTGNGKLKKQALWMSITMTGFYIVAVILITDTIVFHFLYSTLFESEPTYNKTMLYGFPWAVFVFDLCSFLFVFTALFVYICCNRRICETLENTKLLATISAVCALFTFSNHVFYVVIAFINDTHYASNITVYYCIVLAVYFAIFYILSTALLSKYNNDSKLKRFFHILVCIGVGILVFGYQFMITIYFVLIPIRESISKTANSIFVVYQIPLILIGALVVYKSVSKASPQQFFDKLAKAYAENRNLEINDLVKTALDKMIRERAYESTPASRATFRIDCKSDTQVTRANPDIIRESDTPANPENSSENLIEMKSLLPGNDGSAETLACKNN